MSESTPVAGFGTTESVLRELPARDTTALVRLVRDRLRQAIVLGEIPAGSRLNQVQLAKQLGVSRMPVRSAAAELIAEGLLENAPGGGVTVRWFTERELRDVYEVRVAIESRAVRHVADNQPPWGLARIEEVVGRHQPSVSTYGAAQLLDADREFHMAVLDATDNTFFRRSIMSVWSIVERGMVQMLHLEHVFTRAWSEHDAIAQALRAGDADSAETLLRQHLEHGADDLAAVMRQDNAPGQD